jgi:uncharacterized membrane protein
MGKILDFAVLLLYPLIVLAGLAYLGVRWTAILLLLLVGRRFVFLAIKSRETSRLVLLQAALMTAIIGAAVVVDSPFALRVAPFVVSLTFIAQFALSLRRTPLIERFARLTRPDLPPDHVAYCRSLTKVWVGVLAVNSGLLLFAALWGDETAWAIIVGPVSYGLLGAVFGVEYLLRKRRFQEFDDSSPIDRLLRPVLERRATR